MANLNKKKVYDLLLEIPQGYVVTYGDIASYFGNKKMARAIGTILHHNPDPNKYPCYKVVSAKGKLSKSFAFGGIQRQRELLENENIKVIDNKIDLKIYGFKFKK